MGETPGEFGDEGYTSLYKATNPTHADLAELGSDIVALVGTFTKFKTRLGSLIRRAFDEVIDMPRTGRWAVSQLEKTEKTYIGTKVEILLRYELGVPKGKKLDLEISGTEVDVKNTILSSWTIPNEAIDQICILIKGDDERNLYSVGLFRALPSYLNLGVNRDSKRTPSAHGRESIFWITRDAPMPINFMATLDQEDRKAILSQSSGSAKIRELFRRVLETPIQRDIIVGIARQKDALKRVRKNGGARDELLPKGILLLSGNFDQDLIERLRLPVVSKSEFISVTEKLVTSRLGLKKSAAIFAGRG